MQILGIDVGGTGIKAGIVETTTGEIIGERVRIETPRPATPDAVGKALQDLVKQMNWSGPIGMGFPAAIQHGVARTAANIDKSFIGLQIAEFFSKQTGCAVHVANDADVAGMAEIRFGAGSNTQGVVLIITMAPASHRAVRRRPPDAEYRTRPHPARQCIRGRTLRIGSGTRDQETEMEGVGKALQPLPRDDGKSPWRSARARRRRPQEIDKYSRNSPSAHRTSPPVSSIWPGSSRGAVRGITATSRRLKRSFRL